MSEKTKVKFWKRMDIEGKHVVVDEDGTTHLLTPAELKVYRAENTELTTNEFQALQSVNTPQALAKRGGNPLYDAAIADLVKRHGVLEDRIKLLEEVIEKAKQIKKTEAA